ncbi:MAG: hypothetical protein WCP73_05275 [Eubacteriales bacterium]
MNKTYLIIIVVIAAAIVLLSACSNNNAAPSASTALTPSVSLSGTPFTTEGPSSTVTIKVTPLPVGSESGEPTNNGPLASTGVPAAS